jgi:hypothetical protein
MKCRQSVRHDGLCYQCTTQRAVGCGNVRVLFGHSFIWFYRWKDLQNPLLRSIAAAGMSHQSQFLEVQDPIGRVRDLSFQHTTP